MLLPHRNRDVKTTRTIFILLLAKREFRVGQGSTGSLAALKAFHIYVRSLGHIYVESIFSFNLDLLGSIDISSLDHNLAVFNLAKHSPCLHRVCDIISTVVLCLVL